MRTITFLVSLGLTAVTASGNLGAEQLIALPTVVTTRAVARSADRIIVVEAMPAGARALITDFDGNSTQVVSLSSLRP